MWKNCRMCGKEISAEALKCMYCGASQEEPKREEPVKQPDELLIENAEELQRLEEESLEAEEALREASLRLEESIQAEMAERSEEAETEEPADEAEEEITEAEEPEGEEETIETEEAEESDDAEESEETAAIAFEKKNIPDSERYAERLRRRTEQKEQQKKQMQKVWISIGCVALAILIIVLIAVLPKSSGEKEEPEASPTAAATIAEVEPSPEVTPSAEPTEEPAPTPLIEDAADLAITIFNPYTELEGLYTGKTADGIPEGNGSYIVKDEDGEIILSYEGAFSGGEMTGKGSLEFDGTVYTGSFEKGLITGEASLQQDGKLRYIGSFAEGKKNGMGKLYTGTRELIYEGSFKDDRIDETETARIERGRAFAKSCSKLSVTVYNRAKKELESAIGKHIYVRGTVLLLDEEAEAEDIFVLYFNGDKNFPIAMRHTYSTAEEQTANKKIIYCYAIIEGKTTVKINGKNVTLPLMELVCSSKDTLS